MPFNDGKQKIIIFRMVKIYEPYPQKNVTENYRDPILCQRIGIFTTELLKLLDSKFTYLRTREFCCHFIQLFIPIKLRNSSSTDFIAVAIVMLFSLALCFKVLKKV